MSRLWRWGLVAVTAAAIVGTFMPGAMLSGAARTPPSSIVAIAAEPQTSPYGCLMTSCNRGTPAPAAPSVITVTAVTLGAAVLLLTPPLLRRYRARRSAGALSRGRGQPLLHPPQLSFAR